MQARAQEETPNPDVPQSALETKLAYVITGDTDVDAISKAGLAGLTLFLAQRTALEPGDPIGLDIAHDELAFYPLIYWPIVPGAPRPSDDALKRIDTYMKDGGTVLFDTRDAVVAPPGPGGETRSPGMLELRKILSSLDIPELEPVPRDHVLTKTFYLLRDFPGRFDTGQLWVEALPSENEEANRRAGRPAAAMAYPRSSSPRTTLPAHGRHAPTASRCCRWSTASRGSAKWRSAPASTSSCTRSPATTRRIRFTCRRCLNGWGNRRRPLNLGVAFAPLIGAPELWAADRRGVPVFACCSLCRAAAARQSGRWHSRLIVLALANPSFTREDRDPLSSIAVVVVDKSPSQNFGDRTQQTEAARAAVIERLNRIPGLDIRVVEAGQADGETDGTRLFTALGSTLADVPADRIAGVIMITDGRVHDVPTDAAALGFAAPVHALITGHTNERDRRVALIAAPRFGIVGQPQTITYRVEDQGANADDRRSDGAP